MSDEVTIPADVASGYSEQLRAVASRLPQSKTGQMLSSLADLLDPPLSLRDEVAAVYRDEIIGVTRDSWDEVADHAKVRAYQFADAAIAICRRHVEALT